MPRDRDPLDLDDRTARIGRELFAAVRREDAAERAKARRAAPGGAVSGDADGGPFSWLLGGHDGDACHGDHSGDGGSD